MSDKLWRAVYDRFHKPQTDPEKKKENVERYHAMVKMMAAIERQNLLQIAEDKNLLNTLTRGVTMTICYNKLWKLLIDKNMKKKDLRLATGMSTTALAKLGKNQHVSTEILTKICTVLDCDFCDIIELVKEENHD